MISCNALAKSQSSQKVVSLTGLWRSRRLFVDLIMKNVLFPNKLTLTEIVRIQNLDFRRRSIFDRNYRLICQTH